MINYETILSTADNKLTLLKWLQKVEDALKNASLESVTASQPTSTTLVLTFHFADGTTLESPSIVLPRGETGATGATGPQGPQGVSITNIAITNGEVFVTLSDGNVIDAGYIGEGVPVAQYDFLDEEYKKTLNLWDEQWELGKYDWTNGTGEKVASGTQIRCKNPILAKPNTTYHFTGTEAYILFYNASNEYISYTYVNSTTNATTPSNCAFITFYCFNSYGTTYNHDITISEGTQSVGYHPYNGAVMHAIDVEGVMLWENANPLSSFAPATLGLPDLPNYRYINIVFKSNATSSKGECVYRYVVRNGDENSILISGYDTQNVYYKSRTFAISGGANIVFAKGFEKINTGTPTENNAVCIPVAIYGIK